MSRSDVYAGTMRDTQASTGSVVSIAGAAVFGALASMVTIVLGPAIQPSFPVLFYLKFDAAEVVDMLAFLIFGPISGVLTATVHFVILSFAPGGTGLFGASLKFLAVLSTYGGVVILSRVGKQSLFRAGFSMTLSGLALRVVAMTLVNYLYLIVLARLLFNVDYGGFAQFVLSQAGITLSGTEFVVYILGLTAIFNAVHAVFTMVVSFVVVSALLTRASHFLESRAWLVNYIIRARE